MYPLQCALEEEKRTREYQMYVADTQAAILTVFGKYLGAEFEAPSLREIWFPEAPKAQDERTGREIVDDLILRLTQ